MEYLVISLFKRFKFIQPGGVHIITLDLSGYHPYTSPPLSSVPCKAKSRG